MYNEIGVGKVSSMTFLENSGYVMYMGPELSCEQRNVLGSADIPVKVIYLPEILGHFNEDVLRYNFPGTTMPQNLSTEGVYADIMAEAGINAGPEDHVIVRYTRRGLVYFNSQRDFSLMVSYLIKECGPKALKEKKSRAIKWSNPFSSIGKFTGNLYETVQENLEVDECVESSHGCMLDIEPDIEPDIKPDIRFRVTSHDVQKKEAKKVPITPLSEVNFDTEMQKSFDEVREKIKGLLVQGCPPELLIKIINQNVNLSRLKITKQFKIFLMDYENMEVSLSPLPKTVFFFYLLHPEGVKFTELYEHKEEFRRIYGQVAKSDNPQQIEDSISRLVNAFDNSICEKCNAIKKAFLEKIDDNIARKYYVNGLQGKKKNIELDRSMVIWECKP